MPTANESYIFESRHSTQNLYPPSFRLLLAGVALVWATPTLLYAENAREAQISATFFQIYYLRETHYANHPQVKFNTFETRLSFYWVL